MNSTSGRCGSWSWRLVGSRRFAEEAHQTEQGESVKIGIKMLNLLSDFSWWVRFAKSDDARSGLRLVGWTKAVARSRHPRDLSCAVPTRLANPAWARRTTGHSSTRSSANAFAHPTRLCITFSQKNIGPCLLLWAKGVARIPVFRFPLRRGGWRADKAHGLDVARPARECVAPGRARNAGPWA